MPERVVYCGGLKPRPRDRQIEGGVLELSTAADAGQARRINLNLSDLTRTMVANVPDRLADLIEIACYVYCADQFTRRDTPLMLEMGARWHRSFRFHIPVRDLATWKRKDVEEALIELLSDLSEDRYSFDFVQCSAEGGLEPYLDIEPGVTRSSFRPDRVALFSGGLDSFAGASEALLRRGEKVVLVSHQAAPLVHSRQTELVGALRQRTAPNQLLHVGVTVNKGAQEAAEFTQRSRSFLFASLGFVVAQLFRLPRITFYENGVVSMNLPIAEHVLGARATRTTHPLVLARMAQLFSLLTDAPFKVVNPYMWLTKADVVQRIEEVGCGEMIATTFSCAHVRDAAGAEGRHCGRCSQCIDRRFGILAAGLEDREDAENYAIDLFTGAREAGPDLVMAESFVLAATKFATMSQVGFLSRYGQIHRALPHLEGSLGENLRRLHDLHQRHGRAVMQVVDEELARHGIMSLLELPPTSLLSLIQSQGAAKPIVIDAAENAPTAPQQAAARPDPFSWPIQFAVDQEKGRVLFAGGAEIRGPGFKLICALAERFQEDQAANRAPDDCRFMRADALAIRIRVEPPTVRQNVRRLRRTLIEQFETRCGVTLAPDDIVQTDSWHGYRLNPYLVLRSAAVIEAAAASDIGEAIQLSAGPDKADDQLGGGADRAFVSPPVKADLPG